MARRRISTLAECNTHSAVEPLVRAWFLGDCIPGIVADFIEERGEGDQWLLRLLRDDPAWHESLPRRERPEMIIIDDPWTEGEPSPEESGRIQEWYERYRRLEADTPTPWVPAPYRRDHLWTYRPTETDRAMGRYRPEDETRIYIPDQD
jgi:hypothetical protein